MRAYFGRLKDWENHLYNFSLVFTSGLFNKKYRKESLDTTWRDSKPTRSHSVFTGN